ncbi:uncharacterized protein AMSG_00391 [Thecamonas trahens ATCC 50062]|uniref:Uncharacterized protein n=1 Tax=Thecamonas trahens ATCC 50062 TaxID=461836 RepID=A0A0L0D8F5_THETB|nr:hypothetical protein AMSG_00391 [Thecamonas trahens ATCC 50062]KNC48614.1 hypothetical protein AMSG_00391 [Thecamonas trahens ATCC 50062]|eukprot:XP_013762670.1 hypothetical protein AMSG_00391 [Thecamonas trahens ATCC 50062]
MLKIRRKRARNDSVRFYLNDAVDSLRNDIRVMCARRPINAPPPVSRPWFGGVRPEQVHAAQPPTAFHSEDRAAVRVERLPAIRKPALSPTSLVVETVRNPMQSSTARKPALLAALERELESSLRGVPDDVSGARDAYSAHAAILDRLAGAFGVYGSLLARIHGATAAYVRTLEAGARSSPDAPDHEVAWMRERITILQAQVNEMRRGLDDAHRANELLHSQLHDADIQYQELYDKFLLLTADHMHAQQRK